MKIISILKFILICALMLLSVGAQCLAADKGVIAVPRDMDNLTLENYIDAIKSSVAIGSNATLATLNWREIEPSDGQLNLDSPLDGIKYSADQGLERVYLSLQIINTVKRELPSDLMSKNWDDPKLLARFDKLISKIKESNKINPLAISIGNEVDPYFENNNNELKPYISFFTSAKAIVKKYFPDVPVGITVTYEGLEKGRENIIKQITDISDVVFITYYPIIELKLLPLTDSQKHLHKILAVAKNKKIIVQEIGLPSGEGLGLSEQKQAEFYKNVLPIFLSAHQVSAVFIFALHDFPPKTCDTLIAYYGANHWPKSYQESFKDFLCTLGIKDHLGREKLSYNVIKNIYK